MLNVGPRHCDVKIDLFHDLCREMRFSCQSKSLDFYILINKLRTFILLKQEEEEEENSSYDY